MPEPAGSGTDLGPAATRRVEAFIARIERLPVEELLTLAATPLDPAAYAAAAAEAAAAARRLRTSDAVHALRRDVDDWVLALFNRSTAQPGWYEANWGRPGSVEDRAGLARSLGDAVTAVALADALPDDAAEELLGPWAAHAGRS